MNPEVFDSFITRYYLPSSSTPQNEEDPYLFERIIVNLNLSQCPKDTMLAYIKYSERHFLTTGVIFLYTQLFERKDVSD